MTFDKVKLVMDRLYQKDERRYADLWEAIRVLWNLGLISSEFHDAVIREDERLYDEAD